RRISAEHHPAIARRQRQLDSEVVLARTAGQTLQRLHRDVGLQRRRDVLADALLQLLLGHSVLTLRCVRASRSQPPASFFFTTSLTTFHSARPAIFGCSAFMTAPISFGDEAPTSLIVAA